MKSVKQKILIITDWFVPGYLAGGPIQSVDRLVTQLKDEFEISILTRDRDLFQSEKYPEVTSNKWVEKAGFRVIYCSADQEVDLIGKTVSAEAFHKVYLNSFFSAKYALLPLFHLWKMNSLGKVVLAPRGMLGEGALKFKSTKKRILIALFKAFNLHRKIQFHSTDISETRSIRKVFDTDIKLSELGNFPLVAFDGEHKIKTENASFVFASRISPKKNLHFLVSLTESLKLPLQVYGADDDVNYKQKCLLLSSELTTFHGAVIPAQLMEVFRSNHFFVLPTLNENFGHAIIEALANGCPVIISDQTPWHDLEENGAGWVIPLKDKAKWSEILSEANEMSRNEYMEMSLRAKEYVSLKFDIQQLKSNYIELFNA
jgi:glycosyltransferase involved in cell wall biosynthesis